ncbi:MAG: ankyrin repeat domain-containing protein [Chlamydiae bacterium]|nr:ankyrin repeat domain-containing protein [Chlamydiota bacterium]
MLTRVVSKQVILLGIDYAIQSNQLGTFKIWVSMLPAHDMYLRELLFCLSGQDNDEFFNVVLERGDFLSLTLKDVAATAIRFSKLPILKRILDRGLPAEYMGELFVEASILDELEIVQFLGGKKIAESFLEKAFLQGISHNYLEIVKYLLTHPIKVSIVKEGLNQSIFMGFVDVANLCLSVHFNAEDIDEALSIACEKGRMDIVLKLLDRGPTAFGLFSALQIATMEGHMDIFTHFIAFVEIPFESLIEIREIAISFEQSQILQFLESYIFHNFPEYFGPPLIWRVHLKDIRDEPSAVLDTWLESDQKPLQFVFDGQDGYGEGLTRQFYAELSQSLFRKILDDKGLFFLDNPNNIDLEGVAILLTFIYFNQFKTGRLFTESLRRILLIAHDPDINPASAVEEIHYLTDLDEFPIRSSAWAFVVDPKNIHAKKRWLTIFGQEPEHRGIQDATLKEQVEATENYLIQKHSKNILKEFLHQLRTRSSMEEKSRYLVQRIAKECFFEDLKTLEELAIFAYEWEKGAHNDAFKLYQNAKMFLKGLDSKIIQMLHSNDLEPLEGTRLDELRELGFEYLGHDPGVMEKISLIQKTVAQKIEAKKTEWVEKLLFFITGSSAHPKDLVIGVTELEKESFPEARTCFKQLRLSKGYDTKPVEMNDWKKRFLSKLETAMDETGYQKD